MKDPFPPLSEDAKNFKPGVYRHYKGGMYRGLYVARHSENPEDELIIYQSIDEGLVWARPAKMFMENVEKDGKEVPRFEYLGEESDFDFQSQ